MDNYRKGAPSPEKFDLCICDRSVGCELQDEFTLPDYRPEIRRLLRITPSVTHPSAYAGVGRLELGGNVCYRVLYLGEDSGLYSVELCSAYSLDAEPDEPECEQTGEVCVTADIAPDSVTGRVIAPRRIGIRSRLTAHLRAYTAVCRQPVVSGPVDTEGVRCLTHAAEFARVIAVSEQGIAMSDEIIPEPREGELRIIDGVGSVFVSEAMAAKDVIVCRGELTLKLLTCRDEGEAECMHRKLPFTHEIRAEGVTPGCECRGWGQCATVNVSVGDGRVSCETAITLCAEAQLRESFDRTADAYSTDCAVECVKDSFRVDRPCRSLCGNFSLGGVFDASEYELPRGARIIDTEGHASLRGLSAEGGRCQITGEARYNVLYHDGKDYGCFELVMPLRYETDVPEGDTSPEGSVHLEVISCRGRMDGERVAVDSEIAVALRLWREERIDVVKELRGSPAAAECRGEVVVCYPDGDDTLWSVVRRYRRDADAVCRANSLSPQSPDDTSSLSGVRFLIV